MIWDDRIDNLSVDMNLMKVMTKLLAGYIWVLLVWFYIQISSKSEMLRIIVRKKQKNMSAWKTLKKYIKVWRIRKFYILQKMYYATAVLSLMSQ